MAWGSFQQGPHFVFYSIPKGVVFIFSSFFPYYQLSGNKIYVGTIVTSLITNSLLWATIKFQDEFLSAQKMCDSPDVLVIPFLLLMSGTFKISDWRAGHNISMKTSCYSYSIFLKSMYACFSVCFQQLSVGWPADKYTKSVQLTLCVHIQLSSKPASMHSTSAQPQWILGI